MEEDERTSEPSANGSARGGSGGSGEPRERRPIGECRSDRGGGGSLGRLDQVGDEGSRWLERGGFHGRFDDSRDHGSRGGAFEDLGRRGSGRGRYGQDGSRKETARERLGRSADGLRVQGSG